MDQSKKVAGLVILWSALACPSFAQGSEWSEWKLTGGAEYTTGSYGADQDTDILYAPVSLKYDTDRFGFGISSGYLRIEGPGSVVGGEDGVVIGPGTDSVTSESGLADTYISGTVKMYDLVQNGLPFLELTGKVKLPTADEEKGLGTGETDYSVQADVFQSFGRVTPFATLGYRLRGDPEAYDLNDGLYASVGASFKANEMVSLGGAYDYREASTDLSDDTSEVTPFASFKLTDDVSLMAYGVFGLSDASPDSGGGVQLSKTF